METKKSKNADLEKKRSAFFLVGLLICSSAVLMAFTWSTVTDPTIANVNHSNRLMEELVYEIPEEQEIPEEVEVTPPPPVLEQIIVVENNVEIDPFEFIVPEEIEEIPVDPPSFTPEPEPLVLVPDIEPKFKGGEVERVRYIQEHFVISDAAVELGCEGRVYVTFVVNKDGSISDVSLLRGVCDELDKEALRITRNMPDWNPGEQQGRKVKCRFEMGITVSIE